MYIYEFTIKAWAGQATKAGFVKMWLNNGLFSLFFSTGFWKVYRVDM
jgi:hypothetical protein